MPCHLHTNNTLMTSYLSATYFFDFKHPKVQAFVQEHTRPGMSPKEKAVALYYAVRDGWRYDPYEIYFEKSCWKAHWIMGKGRAHCLDKSVLLISFLRAVGIPARLHLAKVKNHIAVEKLVETFQTNELTPHGYVEVYLDEHWVAATPAFNRELCELLGVRPLEFDGEQDSIFQAFNAAGDQFMEYLEDYGTFEDFPLDFVVENFERHYPDFQALMP